MKNIVKKEDASTMQSFQDEVIELQRKWLELPLVAPKTTNHFCNGVYVREMTMEKDTSVIGKTHKTEHLNILSEGVCVVFLDGRADVYRAPVHIVSKEGAKKVIVALTKITWSTIHATKETDLNKLESELIDLETERLIDEGL